MRAIVYERYGPPGVLELREVETPAPKANEVQIRTYASSVTAGDCRVRALKMPKGFGLIGRLVLGISKPRQPILGSELAGKVAVIGKDVTKFKVGDEVIAFTGAKLGCHAEYKCLPEDGGVVPKPANISFEEAAGIASSGTTALAFLRRGKVQRGSKVLVVGASGGVGSAAVMLAKHFGGEVTGVCSGSNVNLVRSLGADRVIDYTAEDFTKNGETYDVILDTTGTAGYSRCKGSLKENGCLLLVLSDLADSLQAPWVAMTTKRRVVAGPAAWTGDDLLLLSNLAESGEYKVPIDRKYSIDQVAEAHGYVDSGRKKGNVILTFDHQD